MSSDKPRLVEVTGEERTTLARLPLDDIAMPFIYHRIKDNTVWCDADELRR